MGSTCTGCTLGEAVRRTAGRGPPEDNAAALWSAAKDGRLLLYGRPSPGADRQLIPNARVGLLDLPDYERSSLTSSDARVGGYLDVLVYPVVHAPDRVCFLDGMSLKDAFWRFVLGDPEVRLRAARAISVAPEQDLMFNRDRRHPRGISEWGLGFQRRDTHPRHIRRSPIGILSGPPHPNVVKAEFVLMRRFGALLEPLERGELIASGDPVRPGERPEIAAAVWSHRAYAFDAIHGDILTVKVNPKNLPHDFYHRRWRAVMLRAQGKQSTRAARFTAPSVPQGEWVVLERLTKGEEAVFQAVRELFPNGVRWVKAAERDGRVQEHLKMWGEASHYSARTISRCFQKIDFVTKDGSI